MGWREEYFTVTQAEDIKARGRKLFNNVVRVAVIIMGLTSVANAEVLKWIDEAGKVHYGDAPQMRERAQRVMTKISSYEHVDIKKSSHSSEGVTMYSTSWCGYCKKARQYFNKNSIAFKEYDIEINQGARRAYDKLGGSGVPVILVGDSKMTGFSESRFDKLYRLAQ